MELVTPESPAATRVEGAPESHPTKRNPSRSLPERIVIVGTSGSGKTTLAKKLASRHSLTRIELDAIFWQPNWVSLPREEMRDRVDKALPVAGGWVVDGNYLRASSDIVWARADTLVWLDYPLPVALARVTKRTIGNLVKRRVLWNGNRETIRHHLSSGLKGNLLAWTIKAHKRHRREFPPRFEQPENRHLNILRFRSPRETEQWLRGLSDTDEGIKK